MSRVIMLSEPANKSYVDALFTTPLAKQRLKKKFPKQFQEVLPGLSSGDPKFWAMQIKLVDELNKLAKEGEQPGWAPVEGFLGGHENLASVSGYGGTPSGHLLHDNKRKLEIAGYDTSGFKRPAHRALFYELIHEMFGYFVKVDLKVAKKSSQGLPKVSFDISEKLADAMKVLDETNTESILRCLALGDNRTLLRDYGIVCAYLQNFRLSPDKPSKVRWVPNFDYAVTGGEIGDLVVMDRTVFDADNNVVDGVKGMRSRNVMGMNNPINILISTFRSTTAKYYLEEFAFTWHDRGRQDLEDRVQYLVDCGSPDSIIGVDVTQFDSNVPFWMFREFCHYLARSGITSDLFAEALLQTLRAPVCMPNVGDDVGPVIHGDPFDVNEWLTSPGLLSGHDMVSPFGKFFNVWNFMCVMSDAFGDDSICGKVNLFLKGLLDVKLLNAGDDGIAGFKTTQDKAKWLDNLSKGYFSIDIESALTYKGYVFALEGRKVRAYNNVSSWLRNTFAPERPWNSKLKPFWFVGLSERFNVYANNPAFWSIIKTVDDVFIKYFPEKGTFSTYADYLIERNKHLIPNGLSQYDVQFLENPDSIHFKLDSDLVSNELVESTYAKIPYESYKHLFKSHLFMKEYHE